jgi:hypothetical protein
VPSTRRAVRAQSGGMRRFVRSLANVMCAAEQTASVKASNLLSGFEVHRTACRLCLQCWLRRRDRPAAGDVSASAC